MTIRAGRLTDWATGGPDSMAKRIESELASLVPVRADEDPVARRKLCVAIARGVVQYLYAERASITMQVPTSGSTTNRAVSMSVDLS